MFKSKLFKNIPLECINDANETIKFEAKPGTNYLFYIVKFNDTRTLKIFLRYFIAMKQLFTKENISFEFSFFIVVEEVTSVVISTINDLFGDFKIFASFYFIELIGNSKRLLDYVFEYTNKKSFLFIDTEGKMNNFNLGFSSNMLIEKVFGLLNKKKKIDEKTYYQLKKCFKTNIPDYDYSKNIKYKPTFKISLEKRIIYNDKMSIIDNLYFVKGNLMINDNDYNSLTSLLGEIKNSTDLKTDFIGQKRILSTFTINLQLNNNCHFCKKGCGNFNVYYCPYCNIFICEKCGTEIASVLHHKEKPKKENPISKSIFGQVFSLVMEKGVDKFFVTYKQCVYHNLAVIVNVESALKAGTNLTFSFNKFGYNLFASFPGKSETKNNFGCSICKKASSETKFTCLNCKAYDLYYDTIDTNGFVDYCEKCFKNVSESFRNLDGSISLGNVYAEDELNEENHHSRDHIYVRYCYNSGYYSIN